MKELNPAWVESVTRGVNSCPYFDLLSMKILGLERGRSHLEIEVQKKHLQPFGMVHGGVYSSIIDAAGFWAAYTELEEGRGMTTLEMKLNYLAPTADGRLVVRGRCIKPGRTVSLAEASVENERGRILAHGVVTLMAVEGLVLDGQENAPPKFL